ncbi:hypothetical protein SAMN04515647_1325 [Cohaesibacter sp. ES.047]|uniref:hypothetical protein n=1 Tax=Cohaesibacter sp. ES.047 TaxID=1798205 RepID=UPI000BB9A430|nr:hypothetical protein [Cohaesibacter sp. ES.047]SNY91120.1 hypothetical protein SAMN04515647_1325 [Cohaesibacter sp. ES.047]
MEIELKILCGVSIGEYLERYAQLRQSIRRTSPSFEASKLTGKALNLEGFALNLGAVVVVALHEGRIIAMASGEPLIHEQMALATPLKQIGQRIESYFYLAELLLEPAYLNKNVEKKLIETIEAHACEIGFQRVAFFSPDKSDTVKPQSILDQTDNVRAFWMGQHYYPLKETLISLPAKRYGFNGPAERSVNKVHTPMQMWVKELEDADAYCAPREYKALSA